MLEEPPTTSARPGSVRSETAGGVFTHRQAGVVIVFVVMLLAMLFGLLKVRPTYVPDPQPPAGPRAGELADRIDPNSADIKVLATLPTLGEKRAQAIVDYRQRVLADHPSTPAFSVAEDLYRIHGIGPAMLATIRPFLIFPGEPRGQAVASTRPAVSN